MAGDSLDIDSLMNPDRLATEISTKWTVWKSARDGWENEVSEIRDYLYATDTRTTTNRQLPFKNSTTIPKLAQIKDNLIANYITTLFPNRQWIAWEAGNADAARREKKIAIESYVRTKHDHQEIVKVYKQLIDDWVMTGNCFAQLVYMTEGRLDPVTGELIPGYVGPKLFRISPHDIVINPTATSFARTAKIIRSLKSLGELHRDVTDKPELGYTQKILDDLVNVRRQFSLATFGESDFDKQKGYTADKFGSLTEYYNSDLVEILEFRGDFFDGENFFPDYIITIIDRRKVVRTEPVQSWKGTSYMYHSVWRARPDNLYGQSPLANLLGMQYKIDKLENLRADIFDQIAHPQIVEGGNVEIHGQPGAPGTRYIIEDGGSVSHLRPDATALQADLQIDFTMRLMEELVGAPREALGIRSPGEKTFGEVQLLDNASSRIFRRKTLDFESDIVEPVANDELEMARRFLDGSDLIRQQDDTFGVESFLAITKEDITAIGKLRATGAKHFERKANLLRNLQQLYNSGLAQVIDQHISKKKLALLIEEAMELDQFDIVQEFIGLEEQLEAQSLAQTGANQLDEEQAAGEIGQTPDEELTANA